MEVMSALMSFVTETGCCRVGAMSMSMGLVLGGALFHQPFRELGELRVEFRKLLSLLGDRCLQLCVV
jgi:hypothetical protein